MQAQHRRKQLIGIAGAVPAIVCVVLVLKFAPQLFGAVVLPADAPGERLAFVSRWMLLPGVALLTGIVLAARRGFYADAIDGTRTPRGHGLEINLRYNQNTLEQTVLAAMAWAALAVTLPTARLVLIPAMATLFLAGRMTFWIGYLVHPMGRAFGMTLTALPTVGSFGWLLWRIFN